MYLPTEHLGILKNSLTSVRAFHIELEFGSVGRGKPEFLEKIISQSKADKQQQIQPTWH